jgi:hypothetical protein
MRWMNLNQKETNMNTPTPETDAMLEAWNRQDITGMDAVNPVTFARTLERQRDALAEALRWYCYEAEAIHRNNGMNVPALIASVTVLAHDGGARAEQALAQLKEGGV